MTKRRRITSRARGFLRSTRAVVALEYAVLVGAILVAVVLALGTFSDELTKAFGKITAKVTANVK